MSEVEYPKYRVVFYNQSPEEYLEKINALADVGYRVHTFDLAQTLLSFHSNKYEGVTHLKDVTPSDVDEYLAQGWEILDTYSKSIRLVKRSG